MNERIHELRTRINGLAGLVKSLKPIEVVTGSNDVVGPGYRVQAHGEASEELKECHRSLLLAKAWLGKVLAELGEETPYKNDGNRKEAKDIEPTADSNYISLTIQGAVDWCNKLNHIEKIDWLRQEIELIRKTVFTDLFHLYHTNTSNFVMCAANYLTEARFHLGFELQRIKES